MASWSACENPPPPQELFVATMFRPWRVFRSVKYSSASIASAVVPPLRPRNFAAISFTFQSTPATPLPLPPTAPIVPATCVPWSSWVPS